MPKKPDDKPDTLSRHLTPPPILVDTREQGGGFTRYFTHKWVEGTMETGDYSLPGCENWVAVERKTLDDLLGCLVTGKNGGRERFERELRRAQAIPHFMVIVEAPLRDLLDGNYRSQMPAKSAWESVIAFQCRYKVLFSFAGDPGVAAAQCQSFLLKWWQGHYQALLKADIEAKKLLKSQEAMVNG